MRRPVPEWQRQRKERGAVGPSGETNDWDRMGQRLLRATAECSNHLHDQNAVDLHSLEVAASNLNS